MSQSSLAGVCFLANHNISPSTVSCVASSVIILLGLAVWKEPWLFLEDSYLHFPGLYWQNNQEQEVGRHEFAQTHGRGAFLPVMISKGGRVGAGYPKNSLLLSQIASIKKVPFPLWSLFSFWNSIVFLKTSHTCHHHPNKVHSTKEEAEVIPGPPTQRKHVNVLVNTQKVHCNLLLVLEWLCAKGNVILVSGFCVLSLPWVINFLLEERQRWDHLCLCVVSNKTSHVW